MTETCGICLEILGPSVNEQPLHTLPCSHQFHTKCIIDWFRKSTTGDCPLCRDLPHVEATATRAVTNVPEGLQAIFWLPSSVLKRSRKIIYGNSDRPNDFVYQSLRNRYFACLRKEKKCIRDNQINSETYKNLQTRRVDTALALLMLT